MKLGERQTYNPTRTKPQPLAVQSIELDFSRADRSRKRPEQRWRRRSALFHQINLLNTLTLLFCSPCDRGSCEVQARRRRAITDECVNN